MKPLIEQTNADEPRLPVSRRWVGVERPPVEQVAGIPEIDATIFQGCKPFAL